MLGTSSQLLPLRALHFVVPSSTLWHRPSVARCGLVELETLGWKWWKMVRCNDLSLHWWKESRNNLNLLVSCYLTMGQMGQMLKRKDTEHKWKRGYCIRKKEWGSMLPYPVFRLLLYCVLLGIKNIHPFPLLPHPPQQRWKTLWLYPLWDHLWFALCHFRVSRRRVTFWDKSDVTFPGTWCKNQSAKVLQLWSASVNDLGFSLWLSSSQCFAWLFAVVDFSVLGWKSEHHFFVVLSFGGWYAFAPPSTSLMKG